jgi:diguanylate cyclase (GGDEF)-like protein
MGVPTALAIACAMMLGGISYVESHISARLLDDIVQRDMRGAALLSLSAQEIQGMNGTVYRSFSLQAAGVADEHSSLSLTTLETRIGSVQARLAQVGGLHLDTVPAEPLLRVQREVAVYHSGVLRASALLQTDFASAVAILRSFDATAQRVVIDLSQLADDTLLAAQRKSGVAQRKSRSVHTISAWVGLVTCFIAGLSAWNITRRTVGAVQRIARATSLVARGEQSLNINLMARGDELGAIVESLRSFQANNERMNFLAHHDALTALPNRVLLHDRMALALADCDRGRRCAIHCLDLDHFKAVNDTLGHPVGDGLLQAVAKRLTGCVRLGDTVARLGGDEFAIVQRDPASEQATVEMAQRIIDVISQPYEIGGHQIMVGASVGVAITPCDDQGVDTMLRNADMALYRAKSEGRSTWRFFEPDMDAAMQERRILELDMRAALTGQQFELYYQPLVNVRSHEVSGFEALIRWHHPTRGMISPAEFIPLAEETGLIVQIGAWVLRQACADAATWKANLKVAVNLSPLQFKDRNLVAVVQQALTSAGLPAWRLDLEITEGVLLQESENTLATLHKLRALGIRISMDDFGTGYSSLSYLRSFPFDKIKIDQSFIRDLASHSGSVAIVRAVTGLSSSLGIHTTAEGVETEEQLARLIAEGCTEVQGYLFSPARPAHEVSKLVEEISNRRAVSLVPVVIEPQRLGHGVTAPASGHRV